ncbi:MAG: hypothetical protein J7L55_04970 [Desulfurococcales archaeon]|nr:hypothetical protein [Desulfurococcales archaeon]
MVDSLKSKLLESLLGSLVKPKEGLRYDVVILSIMPDLDLTERLEEEIYVVKGALIGSEEGGLVDYDSLSYVRKRKIDEALEFRALINKELDILGVEIIG